MYSVTANICDGSDYVASWEAGSYESVDVAIKVWESWWPPRDEVDRVIEDLVNEGVSPDEIDLQIGVWDEEGNDLRFYSESMFMTA